MTDMVLSVRITADGAQLVSAAKGGGAATRELKTSLDAASVSSGKLADNADTASAAAARLSGAAGTARTSLGQMAAAEDQVAQASRRAASAADAAAATTAKALNRQRVGFQQLGYQAGDFFTQIASGGNAFIALAQQSQQAVGALQMMGGAGTATTGVMARLIGVMGGPFGIALGVAIPIIGILASKLFESADATSAAETATRGLASSQGELADFIDIATGKIRAQITQLQILGQVRAQQGNIDTLRGEFGAESRNLAALTSDAFVRRSVLGFRIRDTRSSGGLGFESVGGADAGAVAALNRRLLSDTSFTAEQYNAAFQAIATRNPRLRGIAGEVEQSAIRLANLRGGISRGEALQRAFQGDASAEDRSLLGLSPLRAERSGGSGSGGRRSRTGSGEAAARRATRLNEQDTDWARSTEDAIARINDRWGEQPTLIQQADDAQRRLNATIEEAQDRLARRGIGAAEAAALRDRISEAEAALQSVASGRDRPFHEMIDASGRALAINRLIVDGREDEADVLRRILDLQDRMGPLTEAQRATIAGIVAEEQRVNDLLDQRESILGAYQQSIGDLRGAITDLLSGGGAGGFFDSLRANVRRLRGELLTERLFGPQLRQLEREIRAGAITTGLEPHVDALGSQVDGTAAALADVESAARGAANALSAGRTGAPGDPFQASRSIAPGTDIAASLANFSTAWFANFREAIARGEDPNARDIVVTGERRATLGAMDPNDYISRMAAVITRPLILGLEELDGRLGTRLASGIGGAVTGAVDGYLRAGVPGGLLGGVGALNLGGLSSLAKTGLQGAEYGGQIAALGKGLGIKTSTTGGQFGGALGAASGIPGGQLIGSILGSVVGGLLKKTPKGTLSITQDGSSYAGSGKLRESLTNAGSGIGDALQSIAEQLGAGVGSFSGSIRQKGKKVYANGARVADLDAAANKVLADALTGGGLTGISGAVRKALGSTGDVDKAVREALKVQQVEDLLGGLGSALERQFRTFETQAKERARIAEQYGFDVVAIEAKNAEDRARIADQILTERVGSLRDLLSDISIGDLFEGTADDRRAALLAEIAKATGDAEAGKDGAAARLADLQRRLISTSREAYGTAGNEYASDRANTISTAERIIALENERVKAAQDAAIGTKAAVETNNALTSESNDLLARIAASLDQLAMANILLPNASASGIGRSVEL